MTINPAVTSVRLNLASLEQRERRFKEAEVHYRLILNTHPTHPVALEQLAETFLKQDKKQQMLELFSRASELAPQRKARYSVFVAVLHYQLGRLPDAIRTLEAVRDELASETHPDQLRAYYYLGAWYRIAGRLAESREAFREYLARTRGMDAPGVERYRKGAEDGLAAISR
jgi:tetratricopeptide (TPR) repeat protein